MNKQIVAGAKTPTQTSKSLTHEEAGRKLRQLILTQSKRAGVGHIGSALSIADIIWTLYGHVLEIPSAKHPDRDRFVLAKGHAALAFYASLYMKGCISEEILNTYCGDGTTLGVHPEHALEWVDFATGSLGQGLTFGVGAALAARMQKSGRRVFVLMSDAELNEGSVWEAIMFAGHHKLANLTVVVDLNGQQALGYTKDVMDLSPVSSKFRSFGWDAYDVDGHDVDQMLGVVNDLDFAEGRPHVLVAHTTFGKGVSFMENQIKWHYLPLTDDDYEKAMAEVSE
ncbi:MAG: transketolase [Candidatus Obscuribacterales bacterium]|nr:transketolase [Candidatus Obscuribacterales bacterium]